MDCLVLKLHTHIVKFVYSILKDGDLGREKEREEGEKRRGKEGGGEGERGRGEGGRGRGDREGGRGREGGGEGTEREGGEGEREGGGEGREGLGEETEERGEGMEGGRDVARAILQDSVPIPQNPYHRSRKPLVCLSPSAEHSYNGCRVTWSQWTKRTTELFQYRKRTHTQCD